MRKRVTVSETILKCCNPKLGYTPPKIFKQRARLIKQMAEASMALNEHMKVTDDPDFLYLIDDDDEMVDAFADAFNDRVKLEYDLAHAMNLLIYYDQEEWGEHSCAYIMSNTEDEWDRNAELHTNAAAAV